MKELITITTTQLEEYLRGCVQTRTESELMNYPSEYDRFQPAEEVYEIEFIDEHFMLHDDDEEVFADFGTFEVEIDIDNERSMISVKSGEDKYEECMTLGCANYATYKKNGESIEWQSIKPLVRDCFNVINDSLPRLNE